MSLKKTGNITCGRFLFLSLYLLFTLCFLFTVSGCMTEDIGRMQWEIRELKKDVKNINEKSQNIETRFPGQKKQFDKKIREIEDSQKATSQIVSDLLIKVQTLTSEFQILTGRFEESRYFSEKSSAELLESKDLMAAKLKEMELSLAELKKSIDASQAALAKAEKEKAEKAAQAEAAKKAEKEKAPVPASADIKDIYMAGYQDLKGGKTVEARKKFTSVLNAPENDYSDNARFWIGESYYKDENYEDAILAYEELLKKNPDSDKVPAAMLKQGLAFYSLKDKKTGKILLEKLIEKYPDSEYAKLAERKINKPAVPKKKK